MALTRITRGVIKPNENYDTHNIVSTGIVTSVGLDVNGNADISGSLSIGGVLTYEDVTSIDSIGIITARSGIDADDFVSVGSNIHLGNAGVITATSFVGDGSGLIGVASTDNIITGTAATFNTYPVDINAGMTVAGVSTFTGNADFSAAIDVTGNVNATGNLDLPDSASGASGRLMLGTGDDVQIYHTGSATKFDFHTSSVEFTTAGTESLAKFNLNSSVELYHDGTKRFETSSVGVSIPQDLDVDGHTNLDNVSVAGVTTFANNVLFGDGKYIKFGTGNDMSLYHDGTNSIIANITGPLALQSNDLQLTDVTNSHPYIKCVRDAQVELYHDNIKRLETSSVGVSIPQDLDVDGHTNLDNINIAGVTTTTDQLFISAPYSNAASITTQNMPLVVNAYAGSTTGITTVLFQSLYARRPEFVFSSAHNGNWANSVGQTQLWRMLWKSPSEVDTTDEVVELKPYTNGGGDISHFSIKVTDNSTGLKNSARFSAQEQSFFANNSGCLYVNQTGIGITDSIYHYGDTNTKIRFPAADTFSVETAGTERLRIDNNGKVLIATSTTSEAHANNDELIIGSSSDDDNHGLTIVTPNDHYGTVAFSDGSSGTGQGLLEYNHSGDYMRMYTAGSERLRIDSSGNLVTGGQTSPTSSDNGNIYIKNGSAIGAVSHQLNYVTNAVFNSAWKYITSSVGATRIIVNQSGFQFDTAASGTAGNNITFSNRFNINNAGAIGVGGAYGSSGQVLTSAGSGGATTWSTITGTTINSNTNNYVITGTGTANTLQGESTLTFDGSKLESPRIDCKGLLHVEYSSSTNTNYMMTFNNNNGIMHIFRGDALYIGNNMNSSNQGSGPNNRAISLKTNGDIIATGNITASGYVDSASDIKLKTNIKTIDSALDKVLQLRGAEYDRIDRDNQHEIGVIAQEVEKIIPEVVHGDETKTVSYGNLVGLLIEAVKDLKKEIDELKSS